MRIRVIARDQCTAQFRERVLGPEHPDILTNRNNLAIWSRRAEASG